MYALIKLLAKVPGLRKSIYRYALREKGKPNETFEGMQLAFRDPEGRAYYEFANDFDVYLKRKGFWELKLIELDAGLSGKEMDAIIEACEAALNKAKPDYGFIAHLVYEMKTRRTNLVHDEILFDLVAACYVREDENPTKIDSKIHNEKVAYFREQPDLDFFFECQTLKRLVPYLASLSDSFRLSLKNTEVDSLALMKQIDQYLSAREGLTT